MRLPQVEIRLADLRMRCVMTTYDPDTISQDTGMSCASESPAIAIINASGDSAPTISPPVNVAAADSATFFKAVDDLCRCPADATPIAVIASITTTAAHVRMVASAVVTAARDAAATSQAHRGGHHVTARRSRSAALATARRGRTHRTGRGIRRD